MAPRMTQTLERRERRERRGPPGGQTRAFVRRCAWRVSDWTYSSGWAATLFHRMGLQGRIATRQHRFELSRSRESPPIRMVFASDFHAGPLTHPALLDDACRAIASARPELLLLGGDFVYRRARDVDVLAERLSCLSAPLGIYAVLGNHDYLGAEEHIIRKLSDAGIDVLVNRSVRLQPPHDDVWICGLDDPIYGAPDAESSLVDADGARIVLMHAPDGLLELEDERFDLALCGHTHGGQVALPFGLPIVVPTGRLNRRYPHGVHARVAAEANLLVSRGIGCSGVPFRLFATPEIHLCTLVSATSDTASPGV
jgi:uncharacterized protein